MAPKPEPPLIRAVEDKKAVGGHKQPARLAFVSWATIRRIYDIAHAALWALAVATVVNMIINIPQILYQFPLIRTRAPIGAVRWT